jgi:hypothetical protein
MPISIGTLTSNVSVGNPQLSNEVVEQLVRQVLARLKEQQNDEQQARQTSEIRPQMSDTHPVPGR